MQSRLHESEIHPDTWPPIVVHDPDAGWRATGRNPGNKYTYHQLDDFTDLLSRALVGAPEVSRVDRSGVLAGTDLSGLFAGETGFLRAAAFESEGNFERPKYYLARWRAGGGIEEYSDRSIGRVHDTR